MIQKLLSFILIALALSLLTSCNNQKLNDDSNHSLVGGIYEIANTDSGNVQLEKKNDIILRMEQLKIPGASIAVLEDYKIHEIISLGQSDSISKVSSNTLFQAASVSKYFTSILVLHYVEQGLLDLDTDINQYLKSWRIPENEFTSQKPITLRLLLTHQSGLPSTNFDYDRAIGVPNLVQVLSAQSPAINKPAIPEFTPGDRWAYSNVGFALIQFILEDMTGLPFEEIARDVVFNPLKIKSSTFQYPLPASSASLEAFPHDENGQQQPPELISPAKAQGGLMTSTKDLATVTAEVMKAYKGNSKILNTAAIKGLVSEQMQLPFQFYKQKAYMGLGVLLLGKDESLTFLHNGYNTPGSTCIAIGFPETGQGAVIAVNSANGEQLYLEIIATLAQQLSWPMGQFFK